MTTSQAQDSTALDTIAKAFGLVVIQWGQAEQSLDLIVALLWQSLDSRHHARKIPIMLEPKLTFLRKCFESIEVLRDLNAEAASLLTEFERLSSLRHDLIHGAVASLAPVNGHFVLAKLDVRDGFHHVREVRVSVAAYPQLVNELVAIGRRSHELGATVAERIKRTEGPAR